MYLARRWNLNNCSAKVNQMNWRARLLKVAMYSVVNLGRISDVIKLNSYNMKLRERKYFLFLFLL